MIPRFSREALPQRAPNQQGAIYELAVPRSGLGCGFNVDAFESEDLDVLPSWLVTTGTIVHYETGYVSPGAAVYCPFLTFERARGAREERLEAANNQCAIGGSWCVKALQMLYNKAYRGTVIPELPVSFSCTIDNGFAILNYHWIDHGESYCMAPLCKFDLTKDDHFSNFLLWIEAIGLWGVNTLLPNVKAALLCMRQTEPTPPVTPTGPQSLTVTTELSKEETLIKALKTTFDTIPWQLDDNDYTPVSSSTASWGSPIGGEILISSLDLSTPTMPSAKSGMTDMATINRGLALTVGQTTSPPPAYAINPDLMNQKRLNHAMDEIRDLQSQMRALRRDLSGSTMSLQNELSGMKRTLLSVLRKENLLRKQNRSFGVEVYPVPRRSPTSDNERSRLNQEVGKERPVESTTATANAAPESPSASEVVSKQPLSAWTAIMVAGQLLGIAMSNNVLRVLLFGCIADMGLRAISGWNTIGLSRARFPSWFAHSTEL